MDVSPDRRWKSMVRVSSRLTVDDHGIWFDGGARDARLKVIQLVGVAALAVPIAQYTQEGHLPLSTVAALVLVAGGAGGASAALWYYSQRYVGELALLPPDYQRARISVLDFWGRREDIVCNVSDMMPPLKGMTAGELAAAAQHTFLPLDVINLRQFVLSLRHGRLVDRPRLFALLSGTEISEEMEPSCARSRNQ
eukprot:TRINITY_DN4412_c0_g1_i1.p1 TRINITY_DN4412_c0_g1~~TRINITY_DN4412_c0_g1_i1.p1  ORF type:complete len:195 (-),score=28.05 TRINITY_DN4412_c0_g1_i1:361-945(-)